MGEIWPKKKSAGRRSIIEGTVQGHQEQYLKAVPLCGVEIGGVEDGRHDGGVVRAPGCVRKIRAFKSPRTSVGPCGLERRKNKAISLKKSARVVKSYPLCGAYAEMKRTEPPVMRRLMLASLGLS